MVELRLHDVPNYKLGQLYLYNPNVQISHTKDISSLNRSVSELYQGVGLGLGWDKDGFQVG